MVKPVVSAFSAWACIVISVFAIVILSVVASLFRANSHTVMGSQENPKDGDTVAGAIFGAVVVYGVFLVFCATQAILHRRESRKGAIALN